MQRSKRVTDATESMSSSKYSTKQPSQIKLIGESKTNRPRKRWTHHQSQHIQQVAATILQRRDRLRISYQSEDLTPRNLVHQVYSCLDNKPTAFDVISIAQAKTSRSCSSAQIPSEVPSPSYSLSCTYDDAASPKQYNSFENYAKENVKDTSKGLDVIFDIEDVPSQFHLPRSDSREFMSPDVRVIIILKETDTYFLFELPQLTAEASSEEGHDVIDENTRYKHILASSERKIVNTETQTPQKYYMCRSTWISRQSRKNCSTIVNNWVMYDTFQSYGIGFQQISKEDRFKFSKLKTEELEKSVTRTEEISSKDSYMEMANVILRILASKDYMVAQKRFFGLSRQDPCDFNLELVYGMDLLWIHTRDKLRFRRISNFTWNPVNDALLAVGYTEVNKKQNSNAEPAGIVIIWCAKNPTTPDRSYEFHSSVSNLDWSENRPNLLAIGFYDGTVRIIDVSQKQLTVIHQSDRSILPSYEPHWQVLWGPIASESFQTEVQGELLHTCNQDGRVYSFIPNEHFIAREILRLWRTVGEVPGIRSWRQPLRIDIPIVQSTGIMLLRNHPKKPEMYFAGTEDGHVHRCSTSHNQSHLDVFLAHNGPIYSLEFSPYCSDLFLSCGADWTTRVWADGLNEPLLTFSTDMDCVTSVCWHPMNSTIFVSSSNNAIYMWDIQRKTHRPASITYIPQNTIIQKVQFTRCGEKIAVADNDGNLYIYGTFGIPLPHLNQKKTLVESVEKALLIKPEILKRFRKLNLYEKS